MPDSLALLLEMHPSRMSLNELVFAVLCYETPSPKPYDQAAMLMCVTEGQIEDGDLEEATTASEGGVFEAPAPFSLLA